MARKSNTRNPLGSIFKRKVTKHGKTIDVWDVRKRVAKLDADSKIIRNEKGLIVYQDKTVRCYSYQEAMRKLADLPNVIEEERREWFDLKEEDAAEHTFFQLCDYFDRHYIKEPVYVGKRKVAGYAQKHSNLRTPIEEFKRFFGNAALSEIKYTDLVRYADYLSSAPSVKKQKDGSDRYLAVASVNSRLALLRRIFNVAVDDLDWLAKSPFKRGKSLIHQAAAAKRSRIISFEEENAILEQCRKPHRKHVRYFFLIALDTAMRRGEIFNLRWGQVDLEKRVIYLTEAAAKNTKTGAEGILPMTDRLYDLFTELKTNTYRVRAQNHIFERIDFKKAWESICSDAGLHDLQFRDTRATAVVRMLNAGIPGDLVRKITRHSEKTDTFLKHYTRVDLSNAQIIGKKLEEFNHDQRNQVKVKG